MLVRRVEGKSMLPGLKPGQLVFGVRPNAPKTGQVVIIQHQGLEKIKRVSLVQKDRLQVRGDNPSASTDSRNFGWLPVDAVKARIIWPRA